MTNDEKDMAEHFYGYGRWEAPFWFIGPEQGQGKKENDKLENRVKAWQALGRPDLADLKSYHDQLAPGMHTSKDANLQPTWRRLILLLNVHQDRPKDKEHLRDYQHKNLGRTANCGETCLIELSGLPANNMGVNRDREEFLFKRRKEIGDRIRLHKPKFVVMYGAAQREHWQKISGCPLVMDRVKKIGPTAFVYTKHPVRDGRPDTHWEQIGRDLKEAQ